VTAAQIANRIVSHGFVFCL